MTPLPIVLAAAFLGTGNHSLETIPLNNKRLSDKFDLNTPRVDVP